MSAPSRTRRISPDREDRDRPVPGPLCLWRYLLGYGAAAGLFLLLVYVKAVIGQERARYFTALMWFSLAFAVLGYLAEESYVWWKEQRGSAGPGDYTDPATKKVMLGAIVVGGGCLTFALTAGLLTRAGVWHPNRGMIPPGAAPGDAGRTGAAPGGGAAPFDPTQARPPGGTIPPAASRVPGLRAFWSFDEPGGATAADAGPGRLHATLRGCRRVPGVRGSGVWVTGPADSVELGAGPALDFPANAPFAVSGWVRTAANGIVLALRDSRDGGADVMLSVEDGRLAFLVREDRGEFGYPAQVFGPVVADGNWHHFAASRSAGNVIELVADGVTAGTAATGQSGGSITTDLRFVGREERRIRVGFPGATTWNGVVDELAVFGRRLAPEEIRVLAGR